MPITMACSMRCSKNLVHEFDAIGPPRLDAGAHAQRLAALLRAVLQWMLALLLACSTLAVQAAEITVARRHRSQRRRLPPLGVL
jgi:hypothetical protein